MYNGNTVIEREIKEKYNEVFKIIGEKVGLRKLTYETYLGLNENDTRRKAVNRILEKTLRLRDDEDVCTCIYTINKNVKREDKIFKIDSFFKLGEKIYPKKEEKGEITTPTPDRLFETNDEEQEEEIEDEEIESEEEIVEDNNIDNKEEKKNSLVKDVGFGIGFFALNVVRWTSIGFGTILLVGQILTPGGIGITIGTIAIPAAIAATTFAIPYVAKNWKKIVAKFSKNKIQSVSNTNNSNEITNYINNEISNERTLTSAESKPSELDFRDDLDSSTELNFDENIEEDKPLEADTISEPVISEEDIVEEVAEERPEVETKFSNLDSEETISEPEYDEGAETPSSRETAEDGAMPEDQTDDLEVKTEETAEEMPGVETEISNPDIEEPVSNPKYDEGTEIEQNINRVPSDRRQRTIYEAEQTIMEINKKIEGYEQTINKANQRMKEIQDNKYGYPNQYHINARNVTKPKREYNELKNQKTIALKEMKKYQDIVHELSENVDKIRGTEVPPVTEEVTIHKVPINNWETKDIYIVHEQNPRKKSNDDYTDKFENSRKK